MKNITLEELLEAGCHFGHQVTRQNPKTREFVFEERDGIDIIDLEKTKEGLEAAGKFIKQIAQKADSTMLILGTKRQASVTVNEETKRASEQGINDLFTVTVRWIGGTLTNFSEVMKNFKKLKDLESRLKNEYEKAKYTKKEISLWEKEYQKLITFYGGIKDMTRVPDVIFIIDTHMEDLAVREALNMNVPCVGVVDTNADPDRITYPIPANDDASGSIKLITSYIIDAWIEGKKQGAKETDEAKESDSTTVAKTKKDSKETKEPEKKTGADKEKKKPAKASVKKKDEKTKTENKPQAKAK